MQTINLKEFTDILGNPGTALQEVPKATVDKSAVNWDDYSQRKARSVLYVAGIPGESEGRRNDTGYSLAARLREKFDLFDDDITEVLSNWNDKNTPPLDEQELVSMVRNADKYAKRSAGSGYEPLKSKTKYVRTGKKETGCIIKRRRFSDIHPKEIGYLIPEIMPVGVLTMLVSQEGVGKSTLAGYWASQVSNGTPQIPQGDVIWFSHEEDPERVIVPRLIANGASMDRIHLMEEVVTVSGTEDIFDCERDIEILDTLVDELPELRLVIFDPITSYCSCNENSNREVRRALKPLVDFAARQNVSVLMLSHLSKKIDLAMINRTIGSRAWSAVPRLIWGIQMEQVEDENGHKNDTDTRLLCCTKCNLGRKPKAFKFLIGDGGCVTFDTERFDLNIDNAGIQPSRGDEIGQWLIDRIGKDIIPQKELAAEGKQKWGISPRRLGEIAKGHGVSKRFSVAENCWVWSIT